MGVTTLRDVISRGEASLRFLKVFDRSESRALHHLIESLFGGSWEEVRRRLLVESVADPGHPTPPEPPVSPGRYVQDFPAIYRAPNLVQPIEDAFPLLAGSRVVLRMARITTLHQLVLLGETASVLRTPFARRSFRELRALIEALFGCSWEIAQMVMVYGEFLDRRRSAPPTPPSQYRTPAVNLMEGLPVVLASPDDPRLDLPFEEHIPLSVRTCNTLQHRGAHTLRRLALLGERGFLHLSPCGRRGSFEARDLVECLFQRSWEEAAAMLGGQAPDEAPPSEEPLSLWQQHERERRPFSAGRQAAPGTRKKPRNKSGS